MTNDVEIACAILFRSRIPLFAGKPAHPSVPLEHQSAGARNEGQGRPTAGASRVPLTAASTLAVWCCSGDRQVYRQTLLLLACTLAVCAGSTVSIAQSASVAHLAAASPYAAHIIEASQRFQLPAAWIRAILRVESNNDPRAISPKGAMGLMQIMPRTWAGLRVRYRLGSNAYDPHDNIIAGAAYIRELYDRYGSPGWIAAYNAGPSRYEACLSGHPLPPETRAYVATVVPNLDGDSDTGATAIATTTPHIWTRAPLFIAQQQRKSAAVSVSAERLPNAAVAVPTVGDVSAIVPQSGDLFVTRVARDAAR